MAPGRRARCWKRSAPKYFRCWPTRRATSPSAASWNRATPRPTKRSHRLAENERPLLNGPPRSHPMKRVILFLATNFAVMLMLSVMLRLFGVDRYLSESGLDVGALLIFSLVVGFTGSIISLLMSKPMAKWSTGARVIDRPRDADEAWLLSTVRKLAQRAGIGEPE